MKAKCLLIFIFPFYSLFADDTVDQAETLRRELKFQEAVKLLEANRNQSLESRNLLALLYLDLNWLGKADAIYSELCERKPSYDCYLACGSL
ncbi:MAG: hypothetical protein OEZ34_05895 [Spirochaetia bacterium]|nr:hypothetical protein [Spirochaetia bacterium]